MAEVLEARSALAGRLAPGRSGMESGGAGVTVREEAVAGCVQLAARAGQAAALAAAMRALGLPLPERPAFREGGGMRAVWLGPDRWLVFGPDDLDPVLRERLGGLASLSDQSDSRVLLRVSGPRAREALAKGVAVDLHELSFPPGAAAATQAAHIGIVLWRPDGGGAFCLAVARSYAGSLADWLAASAAEYGLVVE